ncbi:HypC/HybG/HupF family hydrogenase formation chaperone [Photobacterium chitinilyticum]|uniref:HypC/HybG/HupF family hydrogenase formation chaperone n=1 Tax=Photobacterium chitinilyticum TaxID=2485123 RepID=A0A444JN94_9GAMM|nr:HypC/HybG/HupF family hydrogenase formation chaperone [Photobacterium chitinilyticum]RWX54576.1 HypC/HybG/HupF family hydrogenase formation chaperone [Photobacterium chitinilyticum]
MCLSIPSQVVEVDEESHSVTVDTMGVKREVSTHLMTESLSIDDYVLIHIGFVMEKINKSDAELSLAQYQELVVKLNIEESQPC